MRHYADSGIGFSYNAQFTVSLALRYNLISYADTYPQTVKYTQRRVMHHCQVLQWSDAFPI